VNLTGLAEAAGAAGDLVRVRLVEATPRSLIGEPVAAGLGGGKSLKPHAPSADEGSRNARL
jgi:hypothetical protein